MTAGQSLRALVALLGLGAGGARTASAQSANLQVRAQVFRGITILSSRDLTFGNVFPGVSKAIAVTAATSGRYRVDGQSNASVTLTFTLPANLANGANLLPINSWTGHHNSANNATTGVSFTPSAAPTNATLSPAGRRWVFIGATVAPAANQAAGTYTATATLTVAYL